MQNCTLPFWPHQGLSEQIPKLRPDVPVPPGLILTKSLATPRCYDIAGAYPGKISCYAPAVTISPGLILAKSLATPRCYESQWG